MGSWHSTINRAPLYLHVHGSGEPAWCENVHPPEDPQQGEMEGRYSLRGTAWACIHRRVDALHRQGLLPLAGIPTKI